MRKAIKINLGGLIFHIDEDAYDKLQSYLSALTRQFGNNSEAKEIVSDIESRIAELFQAKLTAAKEVIILSDVDEVITIMGKPSDYANEMDDSKSHDNNQFSQPRSHKRKFYRDVDNSALGGVCSGLGAYFNIDPVILRIIFVLLLFAGGSAVLIYLILWIALPAARTSAQKLEMRGEDINIDNIERTVKQDYENVKQKYSGRFRNVIDKIFHIFGSVFKAIFKVVIVFVGIILMIVGLALIFGLFVGFSFGDHWLFGNNLNIFHMPFLAGQFLNPAWYSLLIVTIIIISSIPILALIYLGLKLIFRFSFGNRTFWLSALGVWIVGIVAFIVLLVTGMKNIAEDSNKTSSLLLNIKPYKTLYLKLSPSESAKLKEFIKINGVVKYYISDDQHIYGRPHLIIEKDFNDEAVIDIERSARGITYESATENTRNINFDVIQKDSILLFDSFFEMPKNSNWRAQQVEVKFKIPRGTRIFIDKSLSPLIIDADTKDDISTNELTGKTWIMSEDGLKAAE
jgi:phage shock protein PspC (stress-responsive transcriptional regulator)